MSVDNIQLKKKMEVNAEETGLHFRVEDTGAGVAEEELDKMFEAFSQTATGKASQPGLVLISFSFFPVRGKIQLFSSLPRRNFGKLIKSKNTLS